MQESLKPHASQDLELEPPEPPEELSKEEAEEWRKVVSKMPPDYFQPEIYPILIELCRHICLSRFYYSKLQAVNKTMRTDKKSISATLALARIHMVESKTVAMLLGRLGVMKRTREGREKKAVRFGGGRRPWELSREDHFDNMDDMLEEETEDREDKAAAGH
jgi:hypothetical protein